MIFVNRQCSECDPSSDDEEMEVDPQDTTPISQGRQRRVIKEPTKFTPDKGEVRHKIQRAMKIYLQASVLSRRGHDGPKIKNKIENMRAFSLFPWS